jgi:endonuclease/exonuclease/phosphatase family metal-dependent hydrolase
MMRTAYRAALLVLAALSTGACASTGRSPGSAMRILVYNIHAGKDAARVDNLDRVAAIIRDSRADVALLQEVDRGTRRSGGVDQLAKLRSLTGYDGVFGKTIDYDGGEYGIAVLSRWPIDSSSMMILPVTITDSVARSRYEQRGALVTKIRSPSGFVRVIDTHLDATRGDSNRVIQAGTLRALANTQRDSGFTIVGGDLNSEPGGPVAGILTEAGWRDAFRLCGTGQPFSFPANKPTKRIDYLFVAPDARCRSARVLDTKASDHRPILFEIFRDER